MGATARRSHSSMTESELARIVITHLEAKAVDYVLVGGIAYNFYGIP